MEPLDIRRVAFVTRRFYPLQGFRRVVWSFWLLFVFWLFSHMGSGRSPYTVAFVLSMCIGPRLMEDGLRAYYGRAVGRVAHDTQALWQWGLPTLLAIGCAIAYDVHFAGSARPSIAALLIGSVALVDVVRDWPWRWYRALDIAAGVAASLLWAFPPVPAHAALITIAVIAAGEVITGYLDHRLLIRAVGPRRRTADDVAMEAVDGH